MTARVMMAMRAVALGMTGGLLLALAGCGGGLGMLTGGESRPASSTGGGLLDIFGFRGSQPAQAPQPALDAPEDRDFTCPLVEILDGTAALRVGPAGGGSSQVSHQISINDLARECSVQGGTTMSIKVGVAGRVLIGPLGKPGTFTAPLRIVVRTGNNPTTYKTITTRLVRVPVAVPESAAEFVHVEENIVVPIGERDPGDEYTILVGLDPSGGQAEPRTRRRDRAAQAR